MTRNKQETRNWNQQELCLTAVSPTPKMGAQYIFIEWTNIIERWNRRPPNSRTEGKKGRENRKENQAESRSNIRLLWCPRVPRAQHVAGVHPHSREPPCHPKRASQDAQLERQRRTCSQRRRAATRMLCFYYSGDVCLVLSPHRKDPWLLTETEWQQQLPHLPLCASHTTALGLQGWRSPWAKW